MRVAQCGFPLQQINYDKVNKTMYIRKAELKDIDEIMSIFEYARAFMKENGNETQWGDNYPSYELITDTIKLQKCYVCVDNKRIAGTFYFACENDTTYAVINDGTWLNDEPYAVVHRLAVAKGTRGVGSFCLKWALEQAGNVRVDTHINNKPMQGLLKKYDFSYCGHIDLNDSTSRIAFQKCEKC